MGNPLSLELRERVVEAYRRGEGTYQEIADRFDIGVASVSRWLRRSRETGTPAPKRRTAFVPALIPAEQAPQIVALVEQFRDLTVDELANEWERRTGQRVSRSTMQRAVLRSGFRWKKNASAQVRLFVPKT